MDAGSARNSAIECFIQGEFRDNNVKAFLQLRITCNQSIESKCIWSLDPSVSSRILQFSRFATNSKTKMTLHCAAVSVCRFRIRDRSPMTPIGRMYCQIRYQRHTQIYQARRRSLLPGDTSTNMRSGSVVLTSARHSDYNATGLNTRSCDLSQRNLCLTCDESRALTGVISVIMHDNLRPNFQIDLGDRPTFRFDISRRSFRDVVK